MEAIKNLYKTAHWEDAEGYFDGTMRSVLRDDENGKTILLKLPKGFYQTAHSHLTTEQHFVVEGEYEADGEVYEIGSYQIFKEHEEHGPFISRNGALILVIWDPVKF